MPENIIVKSDEIVPLARGQAVVEARHPLDGDFRILSAWATAVTMPSEVFAGEARYTGKVKFDCVVLSDGKVDCITVTAEFSDKITSPDICAGMNVTLVPEVVNVEAAIEGGALKVVAVVDTTAVVVMSHEHECMSVPSDGVYAERRAVPYSTVVASGSEIAYITDSADVAHPVSVLCSSSRAVVNSAECTDGEIRVSGNIYTVTTVKDGDENVSALRTVTPFVKSVSALGAADGNIGCAFVAVSDGAATSIEGENRVELAFTLNINCHAVDRREAELMTDVFCATNEIAPKTATAKCMTAEPLTTVADTVDGQIPIPSDKLAADNVLCVTGTFCTLSSITADGGRVTAEGLVGGDIVYYNAEKNAVDCIAFRLPFSMPLAAHTDAQSVFATAEVTGVGIKIRRESVFDIKADVAFTLWLTGTEECSYIADVEMGEQIARPDATVIVHIAKPGETLWQAAKALCCAPEQVQKQNAATAPFSGGERLVNFCGK